MNDVLKFIEMEKNQKDSQNSSETNSTHSQQTTDTAAPDGGWGWLVCLGSFVINFILDGTMFSFGVMLLTLLEYFGESKAKTSWIGSVLLGLSMILGKVRKCKYITGFVAVYVFNLRSFVESTCNIKVWYLWNPCHRVWNYFFCSQMWHTRTNILRISLL